MHGFMGKGSEESHSDHTEKQLRPFSWQHYTALKTADLRLFVAAAAMTHTQRPGWGQRPASSWAHRGAWACTQLLQKGPHPSAPSYASDPLKPHGCRPLGGTPSGLAQASRRRAGASVGQTSESPRMKLTVVPVRRNPPGCRESAEFVARPRAARFSIHGVSGPE